MAPPFMNAYGLVPKVLDKIIEAQKPERFTQDFLSTKLGFSGGSARAIIPLLKRIGFLSSDGVPTPLYSKFRNSDTRGSAMAQALRTGYREVFERNEYVQDLPKDKLKTSHHRDDGGEGKRHDGGEHRRHPREPEALCHVGCV